MDYNKIAKELVEKYEDIPNYIEVEFETGLRTDDFGVSNTHAKQCAISEVDGIIKALQKNTGYTQCLIDLDHWQEVRKAIEALKQ